MYRNAAVTLGIEHASIQVASPIPVTGESALAGIYYSLEKWRQSSRGEQAACTRRISHAV